MLKQLLLVSTLLISTTFASDKAMQSRELPAKEMKSQNKLITQLAADEISKSLPQIIDKYTTLVKVKAQNTTLIYIYEINTGAKNDDTVIKEDHSRMKKAITKGTCRSSKRFLEADISISYIYNSAKSKRKLFQFDINQTTCLNYN